MLVQVKPQDWDEFNWEAVEEIRGRRRMEKVLHIIPHAGLHLDVGTGRGDGTAVVGKIKTVIGLDYGRRSLRIAMLKNSCLIQASACSMPFPNNTFQSLTCLDVLEHIPDARSAIIEMHRVLSPGGVLVLQTPTQETMRFKKIGIALYSTRNTLRNKLIKKRLVKTFMLLLRYCRYNPKEKLNSDSPQEHSSPIKQNAPQPYDSPVPSKWLADMFTQAGFTIHKARYVWYWSSSLIIRPFCLSELFVLRKARLQDTP